MWKKDRKIINYLRGVYRLGGVFPDDAYLTGIPKNIVSAAGGGNVGTGLDTVFTFTFPATSLKQNFANFRAIFCGAVGSNDDNKRLELSFGGSVLLDTGLIDWDAWGYKLMLDLIRIDATHVSCESTLIAGNVNIDSAAGIASNGAKFQSANANFLGVNNMDTNGNDLVLKAESSTATNDNITCNIILIDLVRF